MLEPGVKLGRYEIRSQLGAGGMGEVKQLFQTQMKQNPGLPYDVTSDGSRFLINAPVDKNNSTPLAMVVN